MNQTTIYFETNQMSQIHTLPFKRGIVHIQYYKYNENDLSQACNT